MSEYIKREDAMEPLYEKWKAAESRSDDDIAEIVKMDYITVSNVPTADVVEVVRCKDCMYVHANKNNRQLTCNRRMLGAVRPNDYCSLGAYEDGEEQDHEL